MDRWQADVRLRPGSPAGLGEPAVGAGSGQGTADAAFRGDTCHLDVVDRSGLMISATPSGGWLQSSPVVPGLGFPLGTRAQMFWLTPGLPASLRPGARPRTTLSALHSEHLPSSFAPRRAAPGRVVMEDRWPSPMVAELRRRGHDVVQVPGWSLGRLSAVARERRTDGTWLRAAANPRGAQGYAVGR